MTGVTACGWRFALAASGPRIDPARGLTGRWINDEAGYARRYVDRRRAGPVAAAAADDVARAGWSCAHLRGDRTPAQPTWRLLRRMQRRYRLEPPAGSH